jgi:hypothetical protein
MRRQLCGLLLALEISTTLTGCQSASEEALGVSLGTFEGTALLTAEDCGAAVDAPETYQLEIELVKGDAVIYWVQDGAALAGAYDDVDVKWSSRATSTVDADCTLERKDAFDGVLDDASSPTRMKGVIVYEFDGLTGSDCSSQTSSRGGSFDNLPCTVSYSYVVERD